MGKLYLFNDEDAPDEFDYDLTDPPDDDEFVFCKYCKRRVELHVIGDCEYCSECGKLYC